MTENNKDKKISRIWKTKLSSLKGKIMLILKSKALWTNTILILLLILIYNILSPSFESKSTNVYFDFYDRERKIEVTQSIFHITNEGTQTIVDMQVWFKGKGSVQLTIPKWLKRDDNYYLNIPQEKFTQRDQGNTRELTLKVDENIYNGSIKQRFIGNIFSKNCSLNRFSFTVNGVSTPVKVLFNDMKEISTYNFMPQPNTSKRNDYFSYTLTSENEFIDSVGLEFDAINDRNKSWNEKMIFLSGILIGVVCSLIAGQIQNVIE